jgi:hypothetical protein
MSMMLRYGYDGWEIDAGAARGLDAGTATAPVRVAVAGRKPVAEARLTRVLSDRSLVEPIGWKPDLTSTYPMVLSSVPLLPVTVAVAADATVTARIAETLATNGPEAAPSRHLRLVEGASDYVVRVAERGLELTDRRGTVVLDALDDRDHLGAYRAVAALEHIARWHQVKHLVNPVSELREAIAVDVLDAESREVVDPTRLRYRPGKDRWIAPSVFIRLRNRTDTRLYAALLDLTDRFRIRADLFPGHAIEPGQVAAAVDGRTVQFTLPAGQLPEPGATVRDWLLLVVAEREFGPRQFELPRIDNPVPPAGRAPRTFPGILDRIGRSAVHRDADAAELAAAYEWATVLVPLATSVPAPDAATSG